MQLFQFLEVGSGWYWVRKFFFTKNVQIVILG